MKAHLKSFIRKGNQANLHGFRVQVKKLRAFLALMETVKKPSKLTRYLKPIRKLFSRPEESEMLTST